MFEIKFVLIIRKLVLQIEDDVDKKESPFLKGFKLILFELISPWYFKHTLINNEFEEEIFDESEFNWWTKYYGFKYQKVVTHYKYLTYYIFCVLCFFKLLFGFWNADVLLYILYWNLLSPQ